MRAEALIRTVTHLIDSHDWEFSWDPRGLRLTHQAHHLRSRHPGHLPGVPGGHRQSLISRARAKAKRRYGLVRVLLLGHGYRRAAARGDHAAARDHLDLRRGGPARPVRRRGREVAGAGPAPPGPGPGPRRAAARRRPPGAGAVRQPPAPGGDPGHVALRRARRQRGLRRPAARRGRGPRRRAGPGRHPGSRVRGAGGGVRPAGGRARRRGDEPGVRAGAATRTSSTASTSRTACGATRGHGSSRPPTSPTTAWA